MDLPSLIKRIYGVFEFTGLYSFEFIDKTNTTITEIFLMIPPKNKTLEEPTRSTTVPTLGGNYNLDAGNATKNLTLSGSLYFPYVGSSDNPVAKNNDGLNNQINGLQEWMKLRYMLIRYKDYTLTRNAANTIPITAMVESSEIQALYRNVSEKVNSKKGALLDEIKLVFHDYDMDDHYYCRIDSLSSTQSDAKHIAIEYTINAELYEPYVAQLPQSSDPTVTVNEQIDIIVTLLKLIDYTDDLSNIQAEIGYNIEFLTSAITIENTLVLIESENEKIQSGKATAITEMPELVSTLISSVELCSKFFIDTFVESSTRTGFDAGATTLDDIVTRPLLQYYNSLQKIKLQGESLNGVLVSIPRFEEIRYYANADDYTLTEEQFDNSDSNRVLSDTFFYFYTVLEGDTARIIALRELKDEKKFVSILRINSVSENDFIDGTIIGKRIKIPLDSRSVSRGEDNLVYEADYSDPQKFIYGSDIALGIKDEFLISATGDILSQDGIDNVFNNIESRIDNRKGSLNVFHPNWGSIAIDDSNAPLLVKIDRYLTDVVSQIQADPRVESVSMKLDELVWSGETISVPSTIFFVGTNETREVTV